MSRLLAAGLLIGQIVAFDITFAFNSTPQVETRSLDQIYQAALKEGGVVTLWHGGDTKYGADDVKQGFEARFPGMTLNVTVDLSKYHDVRIDQQLATNNVYVDSVILQTTQDYPRWAQEGALLNYAPLGFDKLFPAFKDSFSAYRYGMRLFNWNTVWNTAKLPGVNISTFNDFLKPELKNKLVLTYPNDDDAVLFAFYQIMEVLGVKWFDALLAQNPKWIRGTNAPLEVLQQANTTVAASFTTGVGLQAPKGLEIAFPTDAPFVSWPQMGAILKNAPHPEGAKLLHNYILSTDFQQSEGWSVRQDLIPQAPYPDIMHMRNTNPTSFLCFMEDRAAVERLRFWFEDRIGTAQGVTPLAAL